MSPDSAWLFWMSHSLLCKIECGQKMPPTANSANQSSGDIWRSHRYRKSVSTSVRVFRRRRLLLSSSGWATISCSIFDPVSGGNTTGCSGEQTWYDSIFYSIQLSLRKFWFDSTQDSQWLYKTWFISTHDSKRMSEIWFISTHNSESFQNFDWNQLTTEKAFQNFDSNQLMSQWCYSFPVSVDLFWAFNFIVDFVWPFWGFWLKYLPDKLIWISSWLKQYLGDLNRFNSWLKRLFQELTHNQLMTQIDSQVLLQIDSWLKMLSGFSIQVNSLLKRKTFDSGSTHDSTLSQTHVWRERFDIFVTAFAQLLRIRIVVSSDSLKNTSISEKTAL